ncbi:MAG: ArsC/Spx/MgsR family protein [Mariprofundales bacterium]|nr:ArsC/Spx/MgsR family protein [Mariprofundales bacterium]
MAAEQLGWQQLINRRGTSWRKLTASERSDLEGDGAMQIICRMPALIKRPLLVVDGTPVAVGFDEERYRTLLTCP